MQYLKSLPWFRETHPSLLRNREFFDHFDQSRPLSEYDFVVLDTELTGLNKRRDEIISIGAVRVENLQINLSATFHRYVRPVNLCPGEATLVHKITPEQLKNTPYIRDVLPEFVEFCGSSLLVGHFLSIDMHFLNQAARQKLGGTLANPGIDTMRLAKGYWEKRHTHKFGGAGHENSYNLEYLGKELGLPLFNPHDALEDAMQTAYLFLFLVHKLKQGGVATLKDLYRSGRLSGLA